MIISWNWQGFSLATKDKPKNVKTTYVPVVLVWFWAVPSEEVWLPGVFNRRELVAGKWRSSTRRFNLTPFPGSDSMYARFERFQRFISFNFIMSGNFESLHTWGLKLRPNLYASRSYPDMNLTLIFVYQEIQKLVSFPGAYLCQILKEMNMI